MGGFGSRGGLRFTVPVKSAVDHAEIVERVAVPGRVPENRDANSPTAQPEPATQSEQSRG